jgi:hypothetical protein
MTIPYKLYTTVNAERKFSHGQTLMSPGLLSVKKADSGYDNVMSCHWAWPLFQVGIPEALSTSHSRTNLISHHEHSGIDCIRWGYCTPVIIAWTWVGVSSCKYHIARIRTTYNIDPLHLE